MSEIADKVKAIVADQLGVKIEEVKEILLSTSFEENGFNVIDAEAAVKEALVRRNR